jgi:hypothetical protein
VVRDLNSTNGTFIGEEKITESVLKPGQVLRVGQIQLRLESAEAAAAAAAKKQTQSTMVMQRGVSLNELESPGRPPGFDTAAAGFAKKKNQANRIFVIAGIVMGLVIVGLLIYAFSTASHK